jgi:hypothetical protein
VTLAELLAKDRHYALGVVVVLAEHAGLGHLRAAGEESRQRIAERVDDGADLARFRCGAVESVGVVVEIVFQLHVAEELAVLVDREWPVHRPDRPRSHPSRSMAPRRPRWCERFSARQRFCAILGPVEGESA